MTPTTTIAAAPLTRADFSSEVTWERHRRLSMMTVEQAFAERVARIKLMTAGMPDDPEPCEDCARTYCSCDDAYDLRVA